MTDHSSSLEVRVEQLAAQVEALTAKVDGLSAKVGSYVARTAGAGERLENGEFPDATEEILSWVGRSSLLQRLSTICFLLVVALVLRTVTDNGLVDLKIGSIIGMSYAAVLMILGWRRYRRSNPLAPIFTICGAVLMFTIVVEAHTHFDALPSVPAYILLMLTGLGTAVISYAYRAPAPVAVGNLGMCLAGAAIDYPTPFFPYLGVVLLIANLLSYFSERAHRYSWLRWILLLVTLFMIVLWGIKLGMTLLAGETPARVLAQGWFLPFLTIFSASYVIMAFTGIIRSLPDKIHRFEFALPTINVVWAFALAQYVTTAMDGSKIMLLGTIGAIVGAGHLAVTVRLAGRGPKGARGANAFLVAGAVLLALALPVALGSILISLPVLAAIGIGAARISAKWHSGSVRFTSYLLSGYSSVALAVVLLASQTPTSFIVSCLSAGAIAALSLVQYRWCRKSKPPEESAFFSKIDKGDFTAVITLVAALMSAFFMLRLIVHQLLAMTLAPADLNNAMHCSQSVIINLSAIVLMLFALTLHNKEVRNVAIIVTVIGAINVFLYDLIKGHGVPLVISVLSFGLATAVESVILGRWQRHSPSVEKESSS
jgi:hypothetical protein